MTVSRKDKVMNRAEVWRRGGKRKEGKGEGKLEEREKGSMFYPVSGPY